MSRVAKSPIHLPSSVSVIVDGRIVTVTGPLGSLTLSLVYDINIEVADSTLMVKTSSLLSSVIAMSGTTRAILANYVKGVSVGFTKKLLLVGVGYKASAQGSKLNLALGFSHPVIHEMPVGISVTTPIPTEIILSGIDVEVIGQVAADIRAYRKPEPYKGKGVRYSDEVIILKETKKK
jgi:large subunit ribosomal protein L6